MGRRCRPIRRILPLTECSGREASLKMKSGSFDKDIREPAPNGPYAPRYRTVAQRRSRLSFASRVVQPTSSHYLRLLRETGAKGADTA